ncbi:MAG TPA: cellulase family glycosylhydrolase [Polyangiaceae bacterium]
MLGLTISSCQSSTTALRSRPTTAPAAIVVQRKSLTIAPASGGNSVALPTAQATNSEASWWGLSHPERFDMTRLSRTLPAITVAGNHFVDSSGATVVFQGVSIADPDKLVREGQWKRELFEAINAWGANVVRVPIHPAAFRGVGRDAYFKLFDEAVIWANENSLYMIADWHSVGNLVTGLFQHPIHNTSKQETYEFWRSVAYRYREVTTLAFYELFNEPTTDNGNLGVATWQQWRTVNEELIDIIRSHGNNSIALVAGFDWAYDLSQVALAPIQRQQVAYVSHPYPQKATAPYELHWDKSFGFVAARYPLFATEIGYMPKNAVGARDPVRNDGSYGPLITSYLAKKGASWVAWCFHPHWSPPLIDDWAYTPTSAGSYFRQVMKARRNDEIPGSE